MSETVQFSSGAVRGTDVSEFIADTPLDLLEALSKAFEDGKLKGYPHGNWKRGFPVRNLISHLLVHIMKYAAGDTSESHLEHALFNLTCLIVQQNNPDVYRSLDDRLLPATVAHALHEAALNLSVDSSQAEHRIQEIFDALMNLDKAPAEVLMGRPEYHKGCPVCGDTRPHQHLTDGSTASMLDNHPLPPALHSVRPLTSSAHNDPSYAYPTVRKRVPDPKPSPDLGPSAVTGTGAPPPAIGVFTSGKEPRYRVYPRQETIEEYDADHIDCWYSDMISTPEGIRVYAYKKARCSKTGVKELKRDFELLLDSSDLLTPEDPITFYA